MKYLLFPLFILFCTEKCSCIMCYCNHENCITGKDNGDCKGNYCYIQRPMSHLPAEKYGCVTTRQDLTDFGCERSFKGEVTCVCKEDYCNTEQLATTPLLDHKNTVKCNVQTQREQSLTMEERPICRGAYCIYVETYVMNSFGDYLADSQALKRCSFKDTWKEERISSINALHWVVDINEDACVIVHYSEIAKKFCKCSTDYCNDKVPFDVKVGPKTCYLFRNGAGTEATYCKGDYCFWEHVAGTENYFRGCLSVATANRTALKTYKTVVDQLETYICDVDLCNGEPINKADEHRFIQLILLLTVFFHHF